MEERVIGGGRGVVDVDFWGDMLFLDYFLEVMFWVMDCVRYEFCKFWEFFELFNL